MLRLYCKNFIKSKKRQDDKSPRPDYTFLYLPLPSGRFVKAFTKQVECFKVSQQNNS